MINVKNLLALQMDFGLFFIRGSGGQENSGHHISFNTVLHNI